MAPCLPSNARRSRAPRTSLPSSPLSLSTSAFTPSLLLTASPLPPPAVCLSSSVATSSSPPNNTPSSLATHSLPSPFHSLSLSLSLSLL
ncbi:hypothetical protein Ahy_B05g078606 isoform A [Arachis hypogaea]|uniref:Uncharacterized protein n=1 Tax=Arachis hypogaea TaxID=3818 RepID=A0A444Z7I3_ARAHY|nr:hypothetical protein Ahy_B05g078606 isoform A [Arachis hypogaea]